MTKIKKYTTFGKTYYAVYHTSGYLIKDGFTTKQKAQKFKKKYDDIIRVRKKTKRR